jgi:transcription antitermination factor NusG
MARLIFQKCPMFTPNWLLLQVKPRQELRALENLERQKGECYCLQKKVEKLSRGKRIQLGEALFPGYLFINAARNKWSKLYQYSLESGLK